jgi:hypothetical protein
LICVAEDQIHAQCFSYTMATRPLHERLRAVLTQLSGLSLLVILRRVGAFDVEAPLRLAGDELADVLDALRDIEVPEEARHHHHHMLIGTRAIGRVHALVVTATGVGLGDSGRRELSTVLSEAADQLRHATRALPGFEMVDFRQSCCAAHAPAFRREVPERLAF